MYARHLIYGSEYSLDLYYMFFHEVYRLLQDKPRSKLIMETFCLLASYFYIIILIEAKKDPPAPTVITCIIMFWNDYIM